MMDQGVQQSADTDITPDDRLWAALSWIPVTPLWPVLAIVALLLDDTKERPYVRRHAISSIVTGIVLVPITVVTLGCGGLLYFVFFYWAYQAYMGAQVEVPVVSDWIRQQGWVT